MSTEYRRGRSSSVLTLALSALGATSLELAVCGMTHSTSVALIRAAALVVAMLVAFACLGRSQSRRIGDTPNRWETIVPLTLATLPFISQPVRIALLDTHVMPETMLLEGLRNLGLALAALSRRPLADKLAVVVALFGVLVGSSLVEGTAMTVMTGAFAVLGAAWLLVGYWSSLSPSKTSTTGRMPLSGALAALSIAAMILALALIGPSKAASTLMGLVPTSGGSDWPDPEARSGVGDGPNEVDAQDSADSVGFTQSEVYLESDKPSLYDAFNETFGEPIKKDKHEKSIALDPSEIQQRKEHPSEDYQAGREFSTHRKPPTPKDPPGAEADALLYVKGRAPAHLRLVAYDTFDGTSWREGEQSAGFAQLRVDGPSSPWLRIEGLNQPYLSNRIKHRIKIGLLETASIPSPAHLERLRVGSVNRLDFYKWAQPGVLQLSGRTVPPGTVIDTEARSPIPESLRKITIPERPAYAFRRHLETTSDFPILKQLARQWTSSIPRGWPQVEAVVTHLRGHCEHDRTTTPPERCPDLMDHFLVDARRGPDYLFATAAALMLRSLGYPTRVVGGLYVDPAQYDPIARHIAVVSTNSHLWIEVQLPGGDWVALEPTPGFELMPPVYSPLDRLLRAIASATRWAWRNATALALAAVGVGLLLKRRRDVLDRFWTLAWWLAARIAVPSRIVFTTLRLIERRASWTGRGRRIGETPANWCGVVASSAPVDLKNDLESLIRLARKIAHAPGSPPQNHDCLALCRRVVKGWTLRTFRTINSPSSLPREFAA